MASTPEIKRKAEVVYLGRLEALGLGNPNGIPTTLTTEEKIQEHGEKLKQRLVRITDETHYGCIDGRCTLRNADNSPAEHRGRQVGGTGILIETAINGESELASSFTADSMPKDVVNELHAFAKEKLDILPSAHEGGCGGVNGAVKDGETTYNKPAVMNTVNALMSHPRIQQFFGVSFDEALAERVRERALQTSEWLEANNWVGQEFVEDVKAVEPAGVEVLETAEDEFHGHAEDAIVLVVSETMTLDGDKDFVVGLKQTRDMAEAFAGTGNDKGKAQGIIANLAKHLSVADRLPSDKTPVYLVFA